MRGEPPVEVGRGGLLACVMDFGVFAYIDLIVLMRKHGGRLQACLGEVLCAERAQCRGLSY